MKFKLTEDARVVIYDHNRLEGLAKDKRSSLFGLIAGDKSKSFIESAPGVAVPKIQKSKGNLSCIYATDF